MFKLSEQEINLLNKQYDEIQSTKLPVSKSNSRKTKTIIMSSISLLVAAVTAVTSFVATKKNKNIPVATATAIVEEQDTNINELSGHSLDDLGAELAEETTKSEYANVTGDVVIENVVENNGTLYVDEEAANNAENIGQEIIDDQNGTLEVTPNGDVYVEDEGYEILDQSGNIIDSGDNNEDIKDDYVYDENLDLTVKEEDVNKFVYVDTNYYDMYGNLIYSKGEVVLKETLEKIKNDPTLTTVKNVNSITTTEQVIETTTEQVIETTTQESVQETTTEQVKQETTTEQITTTEPNYNNGYYTIYGTAYMDEATFQAFILDDNSDQNFGLYNGVVYPKSVLDEMVNQKSR